MAEPMPSLLVPGLNCSARLYEAQIPALWQFGPAVVADHPRDDAMAQIAPRVRSEAPAHFALIGLSTGGYLALELLRQAPERSAGGAPLETAARADAPERSDVTPAALSAWMEV